MRTDNLLKTTLLVNAVYSSLTGILSIVFTKNVSSFLGIKLEIITLGIGSGLLFFGLAVFYIVKKLFTRKSVIFIIIQDVLWVLGISIIIGLQLWDLADRAYLLMAGISLPVLLFVIFQSYYLKEAFQE